MSEAIAIIGMGCRFPLAGGLDLFWKLLKNGEDAIVQVPASRWDRDAFYDPKPATPGKMNSLWGGFLEGIDEFDPEFFGISASEAHEMDPQQRLVLEVAWEALENAWIVPKQLAGRSVGVFIGISNQDYRLLGEYQIPELGSHFAVGQARSIAANRLSYLLDLRGPSIAVDTACSSSLVAVHLACQSLSLSESELAIAGGVNLVLLPGDSIGLSQAKMMAPDGRCKTFDARANGFVRGEGCGIVILKPLAAAVRDKDYIYGVIRGSAVNQDGLTNGLTAPKGTAQQAVIRRALDEAGVMPAEISYVEAHGTGTRLGDPIEVAALKAVLMQGRAPEQRCWLGSVKTNIGHLETAAGIAGLIKVVLSLQHQQIPPSLHMQQLNSWIKIDNTPLAIATTLQQWPQGDARRLAGVSAFSYGGSNAHVVVEEAPPMAEPPPELDSESHHLFTISARSELALHELVKNYIEFLQVSPEVSLGDLCFTQNTGRTHFGCRLAGVVDSIAHLEQCLSAWVAGRENCGLVRGQVLPQKRLKVAFLFAGWGSQYEGMGQELYETQPVFREALNRCAEILAPQLEVPLLEVLYPSQLPEAASATSCPLDRTTYGQPALFALEYALYQLWQSWGIQPAAVMGYGAGEYVAACVAGVFSLEDGLKLIASQGKLAEELPDGGAMESMLASFEQVARQVSYYPPQLQLIYHVTGQVEMAEVATPEYWCQHTLSDGNFAAGMKALHQQGCEAFLECGPQPILLEMGQQCLPEEVGVWLPSLRSGQSNWQQMLASLGDLHVRGVKVDWQGLDRNYRQRRKVRLPTYPWQRQRYWVRTLAECQVRGFVAPAPDRNNRDASVGEESPKRAAQLAIPAESTEVGQTAFHREEGVGQTAFHREEPIRPPQNSNSPHDADPPSSNSREQADRLVQWLRDYTSEHINSRLIDERRCIPPYVVLDFGNQGLLGMQVPQRYGGIGLSIYDSSRIVEQLGAIDMTLALLVSNHSFLSTRPILRSARASLREELLPVIAQGRELAAFALTEQGAGSNPRAIASTAVATGPGQWQLRGQKIWTGSASWAGATSVFVQAIDENQNSLGITGFVLRRGAKGFYQGPEALTMGMRGMVQNSIHLQDVPVRADALLGEVGQGFAVAHDAMMFCRLGLGVMSLGGIKRCMQLMWRYSSRRSISTGRLLDNPVTLVRLGHLSAAIASLETLVFTVAQLLDRGCAVPEELYTACKISGPELYWQATDHLVQLLGGRGFIETNLAPQMLRDARVLRIFEGPTETLNMFLGSRVLHKGENLHQFLSDTLSVPAVAKRLQEAAAQVSERLSQTSRFSTSNARFSWAYSCIGELANWALLLGAVEARLQGITDRQSRDRLQRAATWADLQFEQKLQQTLAGSPSEQVVCGPGVLAREIEDYTATIGLVEQNLAGEDRAIDRWLRPQDSEFQSVDRRSFNDRDNSFDNSFRDNRASSFAAGPPSTTAFPDRNSQPAVYQSPAVQQAASPQPQPQSAVAPAEAALNLYTVETIVTWIEQWLRQQPGIDAAAIEPKVPFVDYGMNSALAVELVQDLEDWLEIHLDATLIWNFPTMDALAEHLVKEAVVR